MIGHFSTTSYNINIYPIYIASFEVRFNNKILLDNCISIKNDIMLFNFYYCDDKLVPFDIINDMIYNNIIINYLEIVNFQKDGTINYCTFLKNFSFVEFVEFLDFNWSAASMSGDTIKNLKVKFKYDKMIVLTGKNYNNFIRKIKLDILNKKDS